MHHETEDNRGLFQALIDDGRPLLKLTGITLIGSGLFALFLATTVHMLPHDMAYLGMTADDLHSIADGRLMHFMMHDRVSFGGAIFSIGVLYLWLAEFPLGAGAKAWAWWTFAVSGAIGFASFLAYLGYGYLDTWHGVATLVLLPLYLIGMVKSLGTLRPFPSMRVLFQPSVRVPMRSAFGFGRFLLLVTSVCMVVGGLIIMTAGMTTVFVPQDLEFMKIAADDLHAANPRLIPLIAHDRAGFGGGVCCSGITMFFCIYCGTPSRSLWQTLLVSGGAGFCAAIGVHFPIGYTSFTHLAPAYLGAMMFATGLALTYSRMVCNA